MDGLKDPPGEWIRMYTLGCVYVVSSFFQNADGQIWENIWWNDRYTVWTHCWLNQGREKMASIISIACLFYLYYSTIWNQVISSKNIISNIIRWLFGF